MVVIDATMLLLLLRPDDAGVPLDPATNAPVEAFHERLAYWVEETERAGSRIIIPTPALSEVLVRAGAAGPAIVEELRAYAVFDVAAFDAVEAIELAAMTREAMSAREKREGLSREATWAKIKYDRQIIAIAKVRQATTIFTDDGDIKTFGERAGLKVVALHELPRRPMPPQQDWVEEGIEAPDVTQEELEAADTALALMDETEDPTDAEENKNEG